MGILTENRIEELVREKMSGKSYSEIRKELIKSGMSPEEIRDSIQKVDELVLNETVKMADQDRAQQWYRIGLILAIVGLILSIMHSRRIILTNLPALLIYSPFLVGIVLMLYGRTLQRKQKEPEEKGTGAIRKKRPYT